MPCSSPNSTLGDVDHLLLEGLRRALFAGMMERPDVCEGGFVVTNMDEVVVGSKSRLIRGIPSRRRRAVLGGRHVPTKGPLRSLVGILTDTNYKRRQSCRRGHFDQHITANERDA